MPKRWENVCGMTHVPGCPRLVGLTVHSFNSEHNLNFAFLSLLKY